MNYFSKTPSRLHLFLPFVAVVVSLTYAAPAIAAAVPAWSIEAMAAPSVFTSTLNADCSSPKRHQQVEGYDFCDYYVATVTNVGTKATNGGTVKMTDVLPAGVSVNWAGLEWTGVGRHVSGTHVGELPSSDCRVEGSVVTCEATEAFQPLDALTFAVFVTVDEPAPPAGAITNMVTVEGGGAAKLTRSVSNTIDAPPPGFGFASLTAPFANMAGGAETQAGGHPYELPLNIVVNSAARFTPEGFLRSTAVRSVRDVIVDLPPGVSGSAVAAPQCTLQQLSAEGEHERGFSNCPASSIVGYVETAPEGFVSASSALYNLLPEKGFAAEFGFLDIQGNVHVIYVSVAPTPEGYVVRSSSSEITEIELTSIMARIYGDPAARDKAKGLAVPMFTDPADCTGQTLKTRVFMDSWSVPGSYNPDGTPDLSDSNWVSDQYESPAVTGCEALAFEPSVEVGTSTNAGAAGTGTNGEAAPADSPTGLDVNIEVPQSEGMEALGAPPLKEAVVTLPAGMTLNSAAANGLQACSEAQIGWQGKSPVASGEYENFNVFNPERGETNPNPNTTCPPASKIGTVEVVSPDLAAEACKNAAQTLKECPEESEREKTPLVGSVYLATQGENPFGSLFGAYIVIDDQRTGIVVKVPAKIEVGEEGVSNGLQPGQVRTITPDTPQFPFSELRVHIAGGDNASLRSPVTCGSYAVQSVLTPWSHEPANGEAGTPDGEPSASFSVSAGAGGGACPSSLPLALSSFTAGTTNSSAGAYSPLQLKLERQDGTQELKSLNVTLPPGLVGKIAGIPLCGEAEIKQAEARSNPGEGKIEQEHPSCPAASEVGTVTVGAGVGPDPFYATGHAYLAGPYDGAPFDLIVITPAVAGPFDLGAVTIRNPLYINRETAQVTAKSGAFPRELKGIPIDIRSIALNMNRSDFTFNATNCAAMSITGDVESVSGQTLPVSYPYVAGNCGTLPFHPLLTATTTAKASKADGASLDIKVTAKPGEANVAKTDLTIPLQLPARLTTLQKACTEAQFNTNPAGCPEASVIGMASVHTPVLNVSLIGPIYIVSHGGAAFPDVEIVLQGENVEIILDGKTDIKKGVTYSRFEAIPDAPFTSFEANLPVGPHSIFTTNLPKGSYDLCGRKLTIPTAIVAQNGAAFAQNTPISVSGCPKVKTATLTRAQKLKKALAACKKDRKKAKRQKCEKAARKKYGPIKKAKKKRGK